MITNVAQPLIDIIVSCPADFLAKHRMPAGSYGMITKEDLTYLLKEAKSFKQTVSIGGSSTNSIVAARVLGVKSSLIGLVGQDEFGHRLHKILTELGVDTPLRPVAGAQTGTCLSFVTPDGERTMRTHLGVGLELDDTTLDLKVIGESSWIMLEGYLLTGSAANSKALYSALKKAKQSGAKIAFLASADFVIQAKRSEIIKEVLPSCDMVFYNQSEALLLTEKPDIERATQSCALLTPSSVITLGSRGAIVNIEGNIYTASAHPPKAAVIDTTGAGDVFAGALLAGLMRGLPVNLAAEGASGLASRITTRRGAQLQREDYHLWESITTASNMDA